MGLFDKLRRGMHVYGPNDRSIGTIDRWDNDNVYISGRPYKRSMFDRFDNDRLYFSNEGYRSYQSMAGSEIGDAVGGGEVRVPVREERLNVEKRQGEMGAVEVRKDVVSEQVEVPVSLRHEEVSVNRVDVPDRPIAVGDAPDAFKEGTIRVPVRGEEAVARKEAVVTGEVVIDRDVKTETETVSDTIRKERVDVNQDFARQREGFRQHFAGRRQSDRHGGRYPHLRGCRAELSAGVLGRVRRPVRRAVVRRCGARAPAGAPVKQLRPGLGAPARGDPRGLRPGASVGSGRSSQLSE